jgi:hypothetical protein
VKSREPSHQAAGEVAPVFLLSDLLTGSTDEDGAALTLDGRGMIRDCNHAAEALFRCRRSELVWRQVSVILPELAGLDLLPNGAPNPHLRYLGRIGRTMSAVAQDGQRFAVDLFLNALSGTDPDRLRLVVRPIAGLPTRQLATVESADGDLA